jgi:hypothetical protein
VWSDQENESLKEGPEIHQRGQFEVISKDGVRYCGHDGFGK